MALFGARAAAVGLDDIAELIAEGPPPRPDSDVERFWLWVDADPAAPEGKITAIGASPGVIEGRVRVVLDPAEVDVIDEGEILIARNTDPAWASLMFLAAGLVSDIGGLMSHTAVIARELGIPCVVNARTATRALATGDRIRLDGTRGTIELLERARPGPPGEERLR